MLKMCPVISNLFDVFNLDHVELVYTRTGKRKYVFNGNFDASQWKPKLDTMTPAQGIEIANLLINDRTFKYQVQEDLGDMLQHNRGNLSATAVDTGMNRGSLRNLMHRYDSKPSCMLKINGDIYLLHRPLTSAKLKGAK